MFVRSAQRPFGRYLPPSTARGLVVALYALYPVGCFLQLVPENAPFSLGLRITGLILVVLAFGAFAVLAGSSLQRQTQEPELMLDERELAGRNRAAYRAHAVFASVVLAGLIYLMLRQDLAEAGKLDLWVPTLSEHWNAIFFGFLMLALTLPAAFLAFEKTSAEMDADA